MKIATLGTTVFALLCLYQTSYWPSPPGSPAINPGRTTSKRLHTWWRDPAPGQRPFTTGTSSCRGSRSKETGSLDPDGKTVVFRGLAISDPDKLEMQGH